MNNIEIKRSKELYGWEMLLKRMEAPTTSVARNRNSNYYPSTSSSRQLKITAKSAPQLKIGTFSMKNLIKEPKVISTRRKF